MKHEHSQTDQLNCIQDTVWKGVSTKITFCCRLTVWMDWWMNKQSELMNRFANRLKANKSIHLKAKNIYTFNSLDRHSFIPNSPIKTWDLLQFTLKCSWYKLSLKIYEFKGC